MINPVAGPTSHDPKALLQLMKMMRGGSAIDERVFPKNTVTSDVNSDMAREVQTALSAPTGVSTVKGRIMTVARITEISSVSDVSFQDAIVQGVERANKTLKNVKGAWVKDQEVTIDNGKVTGYKVILKVTFVLAD
jgi:dodecin